MGAAMRIVKEMDWGRFSIDEWLKQYAAFLSINRMKGGHEPSCLEVNTIYWLIRENNTQAHGLPSKGRFIYLQIDDFEFEQLDKLITNILNKKTICASAKVCVSLYLKKMIEGLTENQMGKMFTYSESKIREMVYCGRFYLAGHDKRLKLDT